LLEELGHSVEAAEPPIDGMRVAKAYLLLYTGQVAADLRQIAQAMGPKAVVSQVEPPTRALGLMGEAISAAEYVQSRRSWNDFARAMADFHSRFDLYLTPTTASLPTLIGEQAQSPLETMALRIVNRIGAGRALRASGLPERLAFENLGVVPFTQLANLTGQPAMSVPLYWSADGLPLGVQFMAPIGDEESLLRLARQLEEARPWADRVPPLAAALS
jgi:amidase